MWCFSNMWGRSTAVLAASVLVASCGFRPLYAERATGVSFQLAAIEINVIDNRVGQILGNHLRDQFNPYGRPSNPLYRLGVTTNETKQDLAIRKDETATRANLTLSADFTLSHADSGKELIRGSVQSTNSYNILSSDFATLSAEDDARRRAVREIGDDIKTRLASFLAFVPETPSAGIGR